MGRRENTEAEKSKEGKIKFHPPGVGWVLLNLPLTLTPNKAFLSVS